jgi:hypothetical protein
MLSAPHAGLSSLAGCGADATENNVVDHVHGETLSDAATRGDGVTGSCVTLGISHAGSASTVDQDEKVGSHTVRHQRRLFCVRIGRFSASRLFLYSRNGALSELGGHPTRDAPQNRFPRSRSTQSALLLLLERPGAVGEHPGYRQPDRDCSDDQGDLDPIGNRLRRVAVVEGEDRTIGGRSGHHDDDRRN